MSNWDGEGVPKSGQVCEILTMPMGAGIEIWKKIEVKYVGERIIVYSLEGREHSTVIGNIKIQPIKTPEQVEEEKAIDGMCQVVQAYKNSSLFNSNVDCSGAIRFCIEALHKAGYHSQPKVKELNVNDYCNATGLNYDQRMTLKALIRDGYIIEGIEC